jgi:PAS domain S-box-containing protein
MELDDLGDRLVSGMADALVVADAHGAIRFWNAGAERIFGFLAAEALGRSLDLIMPENLRRRHWDGYERAMRTGGTRYGAGELLSVPALRKDGARISVQFSILPLPDPAGGLRGIAAVMRDVTEDFELRKRLRRELEECRRLRRGNPTWQAARWLLLLLGANTPCRRHLHEVQVQGATRPAGPAERLTEELRTIQRLARLGCRSDARNARFSQRRLRTCCPPGRCHM